MKRNLLHVLNHPVDRLVDKVHHHLPLRNKKVHKVGIGILLMFTGPVIAMAGHDWPGILKTFTEVFGFFVHGYGSLPIIKVIREKFDIEEMNEKPKAKVCDDYTPCV